jgi:type VI protein secretion system component VasF
MIRVDGNRRQAGAGRERLQALAGGGKLTPVTFDDLEREWRRRQRGRRREVTFVIVAGVALLAVLAVAAWFLWPRLAGLVT